MPLIINNRASRVTLCEVPFEENGVTISKDFVVLPAEEIKTDTGLRVEPSKTRCTKDQAEVIRNHPPSKRLFDWGVLKFAADPEEKQEKQDGKKAA